MLYEKNLGPHGVDDCVFADDNVAASIRQHIARQTKATRTRDLIDAEIALPASDVAEGLFRGRNPREGYQRGWGLQFGNVAKQLSTHPLYRKARAASQLSVLTEARLQNLFLIVTQFMRRLPSQNIIEFGSYHGGAAIFMACVLREVAPEAVVYALDTFNGISESDKHIDHHKVGDFADADLNRFRQLRDQHKLANLKICRGRFENSFPEIASSGIRFGMAHIDCDTYSATSYCEKSVWAQMVHGGYVVFDDADTSSCLGATEAVEDLIIRRRIHSEQAWPHFVFRTGLN